VEFILLLGIPLLGAMVLGVYGARHRAAEINSVFSLGTFLAVCALTGWVIGEGNLIVARE